MKEATASARAITRPGDRGSASGLIAEIAAEAETKEARHEMKQHQGASVDETLQRVLTDLQTAAAALTKLPEDERAQVGAWLVDIAKAVAGGAKTVKPNELAAIDKIAALFTPTGA